MGPCTRAAFVALAAAAMFVLPMQASADREKASALRQGVSAAPVKDCTRFNGRYGYYGNPWCTPAEQARWDRWDARRTLTK